MDMKYDDKAKGIIKAGSIAAFVQLALIIGAAFVGIFIGTRPMNAVEAFKAFESSNIAGLLQDELLIVTMISMYFFTFSAIYFVLKDCTKRYGLLFFSVLFTFVAAAGAIISHSAFSLMNLSKLYYAAESEAVKSHMIAAAEAVIARNMWNSTSSYFAGILLQGAGVMVSVAMVATNKFSKVTILTGILGNGLDLIQHLIHYPLPEAAKIIVSIAGVFYFVWYISLGIDLMKNYNRKRA